MSNHDIKFGLMEELEKRCNQMMSEKDFSWTSKQLEQITALTLSEQFKCSRNLISHYMSEFQQQGKVVKINTRPVYFFWTKSIFDLLQIHAKLQTYETLEDFKNELKDGKKKNAFRNFIGAEDSLSYVVEQCKASMSYPGNGLPILLQGPTGIGKSLIAQLMYDYGVSMEILSSESRFVTVNCSEYANNPEMLMTNLFGYKKGAYTGADKDKQGLLSLADGGVLFMDEVHGLKPECQEKIFLFMDKGIYHMVGDNDTWFASKARLIFATTEQPDEVLLKTLLRRIPLIVKVPALHERPIQEKKELIHYLIKEEEKNIGRNIAITKFAYQTLEQYTYTGNIGEMKNSIRASVAKAFLRDKGENHEIPLHIYDLPSEMLKSTGQNLNAWEYDDRTLLTSDELLCTVHQDSKLYNYNKQLLHKFQTLGNKEEDMPMFLESCCLKLEQYVDFLFSENAVDSPKLHIMQNLLNNIMNIVVHKYQLDKFSNNEVSIIVRFINDYSQNYISLSKLKIGYQKEIENCINILRSEYSLNFNIITDIWQLMSDALDIRSEQLGYLDIFMFFHYFNRNLQTSSIPVVIIAHGYSIASGIAEVANQLLKQHIFDAIDMPIESDFHIIVEKLSEYLKRKNDSKEIIVMVDMGSLEDIHQYLENIKFMDIGIINNVTTKLALDIGSMILENMPIQEILKESSERNQHHYEIVKNRKKQDAIVSVCETGIGTAEKISNLIAESLPENIHIVMIPYEYESLRKAGKNSLLFEKYNVLFVVGTKDPHIQDIPFISLEEMIEQKSVEKTNLVFENRMRIYEIEKFNENMIKNFSIDNLLDYLTILDSDKIINSVEKIIKRIQRDIHITLSSNIVLGLYIHISCLIERLIINTFVTKFDNLDTFVEEHATFIQIVKRAFYDVEMHYNVEIPVSEIGYIYEYIYERDSVKNIDDSVNELWDTIEYTSSS